jgi:hypothetical protein
MAELHTFFPDVGVSRDHCIVRHVFFHLVDNKKPIFRTVLQIFFVKLDVQCGGEE